MAGSDKEPQCYEGASRLEHEFAPQLIDSGAALAIAVFSIAARLCRALRESGGSVRRRGNDRGHPSPTRST
jgi:hypothetical protein